MKLVTGIEVQMHLVILLEKEQSASAEWAFIME